MSELPPLLVFLGLPLALLFANLVLSSVAKSVKQSCPRFRVNAEERKIDYKPSHLLQAARRIMMISLVLAAVAFVVSVLRLGWDAAALQPFFLPWVQLLWAGIVTMSVLFGADSLKRAAREWTRESVKEADFVRDVRHSTLSILEVSLERLPLLLVLLFGSIVSRSPYLWGSLAGSIFYALVLVDGPSIREALQRSPSDPATN